MAETELNIALKLIDEASEPIKTAITGIKQETQKLSDTSVKAGQSIQKEFKEAGKSLREFRQAMFLVGITVFGIIKATKDWAETNDETKKAYDNLAKSIKGISASVGSIFAPAIVSISELVTSSTDEITGFFNTLREGYSKFFEAVTFGTQFNVAFFTSIKNGTPIITAYKDAMEIANRATREMQQEFDRSLGRGQENNVMDLGAITISKEKSRENAKNAKDAVEVELTNLQKTVKKVTDSIAVSFGSMFAEVLVEGKSFGEAMKELFKEMVKAILAEIARIAAVKLVAKIFGLAHQGGDVEKKHSGGMIRAHQGLAVDEVPIIAQTGEGILSRKGMDALGGSSNLAKLNQGQSLNGSGGDVNVNVYYPKMSSKEEVQALAGVLGQEIQRQLVYARGI